MNIFTKSNFYNYFPFEYWNGICSAVRGFSTFLYLEGLRLILDWGMLTFFFLLFSGGWYMTRLLRRF